MAQPTLPLESITVTPLALLISRTAYHKLLDIRREPHHPEPTVLDFLVSVRGLTGWVLAQHDLRDHHPQKSQEDTETFLWELEAQRNEVLLANRSLLDKSSEGWLRAQWFKEQRRRSKMTTRKGQSGPFSAAKSADLWSQRSLREEIGCGKIEPRQASS